MPAARFRMKNLEPMFFASIPEGCSESYSRVEADGRTFYCKKDSSPSRSVPKRRHSDNLRDPLFVSKDTNRKLNMLRQFTKKYRDIGLETDKYIGCIEECIGILKRDFAISPLAIFQAFDLQGLGFMPEDYGIEEMEGGTSNEL